MCFHSENNREYFSLCVLQHRVPGEKRERAVTVGGGPVCFKLCVLIDLQEPLGSRSEIQGWW